MTAPDIACLYWADRVTELCDPLVESARRQGLNPMPIGLKPLPRGFHSSLFKQSALLDAVRHMPEQQIVCATDGFDVFYQGGAEEIGARFLDSGSEVLFSAERGYTHQYEWAKPHFDACATGPYRYLNAGSVVGYAGALAELYAISPQLRLKVALARHAAYSKPLGYLDRLGRRIARRSARQPLQADAQTQFIPWFRYTDQAYLAQQLARNSLELRIDLDRHCQLFWCAAFEWDDIDRHYTVADGRLRNNHTQATPVAVHVPWQKQRDVFMRLYETYVRASSTRGVA